MQREVDNPKFRINQVVRFNGAQAVIESIWWNEHDEWMYRIYVARGKGKGTRNLPEPALTDGVEE